MVQYPRICSAKRLGLCEFCYFTDFWTDADYHLLKIKRESDGFGFGEMLGSNWWIALILGALLTLFGVIVILNPMLGLGVIGVLIGCGVITAGVNLIYLGCSPWIL